MLPERFFLGQPVRSLQFMLREISYLHPFLPRVIPDGIFEEETRRAVTMFQQNFDLPVTGIVDNDTWDTIAAVYRRAAFFTGRPRRPDAYPTPAYTVEPGKSTIHMLIFQSMFKSLSHVLTGAHDVEVNGRHTGLSVENALWLQRKGGLEETGIFDNPTWNLLTRLYGVFITRNLNFL